MLGKTMDDEPVCVCVCVCVLGILITKGKLLPLSNYNLRIYNFLQKLAAHLKPCSGTPVCRGIPVAEHCDRIRK
jgi:hypothetical protein